MEFGIGVSLACVGIAVALGQWLVPAEMLSAKLRAGLIIFAAVVFIGGVGFLLHAGWLYMNPQVQKQELNISLDKPKPSEQPVPPPPPQKPSNALLVRFKNGHLPITVNPGSVAYVLQLNPNITHFAVEVPNNGRKSFTWPADLKIKKDGPPSDSIVSCVVTNHEDKALLDLSIPFGVSFHELEMVEARRSENKDGSVAVSVKKTWARSYCCDHWKPN